MSATEATLAARLGGTARSFIQHAVDEAARLLRADGAMVYLIEEAAPDRLRFAAEAGIRSPEVSALIRDLDLPIGVGLFGTAAKSGELVVTGDYRKDKRFRHSDVADRIVRVANMRSFAVAPLIAQGEVLGGLGAYSSRVDDFDEGELALLQALADHAAASIWNTRLIERLNRSQQELARSVEAQRTLTAIAAAISSLRDPGAVLSRTVDEAARLLDAETVIIQQVRPGSDVLDDYRSAGERSPTTLSDVTVRIGDGVSGRAVEIGEVVSTGDYLADGSFRHTEPADAWIKRRAFRSAMSAPLIGEGGPIGAVSAFSQRPDAFGEPQAELLGALAAHAAIAVTNARLDEDLRRQASQLARRVEEQRTLAAISLEITSLRDPAAVLQRTVDEARRLLEADHAVIHQRLPGTNALADYRLGGDGGDGGEAGVSLDDPTIQIGAGIAGKAVADSKVAWTGDYLADRSFPHTPQADAYMQAEGFRSQISAPLIGEGGALGALSIYAVRENAFGPETAELLGALASQAAIVLNNARLYREVEESANERGRRVEAQRTLAEIARQLTAIRDSGAVLQRTVDEAARLLGADGGRIDLIEEGSGALAWAFGHSQIDRPIERGGPDDVVRADEGISGLAVIEGRPVFTGDYLNDDSFVHAAAPDEYIREHGIVSVMAAPLFGEDGAIGTLTVHSGRRQAFGTEDAELLGALASHAAIAVSNATLYEKLGARVEAQRTLAEIAAEITALRDPSAVVQRAVDEAMRLLGGDAAMVNPLEPGQEMLGLPLAYAPADQPLDDVPVAVGEGISGRAIAEERVVRTGDYLADPVFDHSPELDAYITRRQITSLISAPLKGTSGRIGVLTVQSGRRDAFDDDDAELLGLLADQAAIAISNARLYEELRDRADAQRSLAELAGQIASLHDPLDVVQRSVAHAARLLRADRAQVNLLAEPGDHLERPIAAAPSPPSETDVEVPIGSGIAGLAAAERRVRWTGDYLADASFPHDVGDARIAEQAIHSMMSAPLIGPDRLLGTITVQSSRIAAFDAEDGELLKLLADQAAIAITNARLYEQLTASEERYRFLVDNSPDLIWSCDADGRFTFLSESVERLTGFRAEEALGQHWTTLTAPESVPIVEESWERMRAHPEREERLRIEIPHKDGGQVLVEIHAQPTTVDGVFAGVHGVVRDVSERERLERDLRRQAADLAAGEERAHLARELHDSVTQALFSMGLTTRSLELLLETDLEAARAKLTELRELQRDALAEMRTLIFELRPRSLEQDGLAQAIKTHASAVQGRTGLAVSVDADLAERLPIEQEEALYRIGQEALHNVVKHAGASNARIRLAREGDSVCLSVADDGSGFDPAQVGRGHLGLVGMRQRADRMGAELRVDSRPGRGTTVEVSVPVTVTASPEPTVASAE